MTEHRIASEPAGWPKWGTWPEQANAHRPRPEPAPASASAPPARAPAPAHLIAPAPPIRRRLDSRARPVRAPARRPARPPRGAPAPRRPAPPRSGPGRSYVRQLDVTQAICWQLAVLGVVFTINQPTPALVTASTVAGVVVALTAVRVRGRWLYQLAAIAIAYVHRDHRRDLPESASKTPALLGHLVPGATTVTTETSHGQVMTVSDPDGLAAILQPTNQRGDLIPVLPPPGALLAAAGDGAAGVQTIFHAGVRRSGPPKMWVCVQAVRTVETPRDEELTLVLRNALRRVRRAVGRAGAPVEPLAEEAGFAVVAGLAHVTGGRNEIREDWRFWRAGAVSQATFRIDGLDRLKDPRRMVTGFFALTRGVAVTVALGARSSRHGTHTGGVLRLAATTEAAVQTALAAVTARAVPPEIRLARLDGTHSAGVAASLPIGVIP